jgi:hypothetical protein
MSENLGDIGRSQGGYLGRHLGLDLGSSGFWKNVLRGVGVAGIGYYGIPALFGGGAGAAAGADAGAVEAGGGGAGGMGSMGLEGSGTTSAAGEGAIDGSSSTSWMDYLQRYGRQASNLLSNSGGLGGALGSNAPMPTIDNSMILPIPPQQPQSDLTPGLLTMLLANAMQQQLRQPQSNPSGPAISGGMV